MNDRVQGSHYSEADYLALEEALADSDQGRWFLAEHARRGGDVDTRRLLSSLERLQRVVEEHTGKEVIPASREMEGIAAALSQMTFGVIGAPDPTNRRDPYGRVGKDAERASSLISDSADRIVNLAGALEVRGDARIAEALRLEVDVILEALSIHSANARRIVALAEILVYARRRIATLAAPHASDQMTA
jgi:hypothetical protein